MRSRCYGSKAPVQGPAGAASRSVSRVLLDDPGSRPVTCWFIESLQDTAGARPPPRHADFGLNPGGSGSHVILMETQPLRTDDPLPSRSEHYPALPVLKRDLYAAAGDESIPTAAKRCTRRC